MVDYVVLLELPFSLQLESEYEKVKTVLKEEVQNLSHNEDSSQNNQSEPKLEGGVRASATSFDRSLWDRVPALWSFQQIGRGGSLQPTGSRMGLRVKDGARTWVWERPLDSSAPSFQDD